ncbi:MAG: AAA family ATPase [Candidatus Micrarchaeia archaeon]
MIIGLTGKNCAGKDTVADYLKRKGYSCFSLSDVIRDELKKNGVEITRENLIAQGNRMRKEYGSSIFAKRIMEKVQASEAKNYVIVSIRNPVEVKELRKMDGFTLVNVHSDPKFRFDRMRARAREGDPKTFEQFRRIEAAEAKNADPSSQQLDEVISMADFTLKNNDGMDELEQQINSLLSSLSKK